MPLLRALSVRSKIRLLTLFLDLTLRLRSKGMENTTPTNAKSGNAYQGANLKKLQKVMADKGYTDPRFVSFNQARDMGYWVKKGSKADARVKGMDGTYCVFNVAQTTIPAAVVSEAAQEGINESDAFVDEQEARWESADYASNQDEVAF